MVNGDTVGVKIGGAGHGDHVEYCGGENWGYRYKYNRGEIGDADGDLVRAEIGEC